MKPVKTRYLYNDVHFSVKNKNNRPTIIQKRAKKNK